MRVHLLRVDDPPVPTRMQGDVGAGGETPPATRLGVGLSGTPPHRSKFVGVIWI